jgi:hypothetical protein
LSFIFWLFCCLSFFNLRILPCWYIQALLDSAFSILMSDSHSTF